MPFNDSFGVDAYAGGGNLVTGQTSVPMATLNTDVFLATTPAILGREANDFPSVPMATLNTDVHLVPLPSPARLKVWDGAQWLPVRGYYYDAVAQAWLPTTGG